jgi:hypothetical protein
MEEIPDNNDQDPQEESNGHALKINDEEVIEAT